MSTLKYKHPTTHQWVTGVVDIINEEPVLTPLSVTANGTYTPETGVDGFNSVDVNVPGATLTSLSVTANGTYTPGSGTDGYNEVVVNVPNPSTGTLNISSNGTYDVTNFANAEVAVPSGGNNYLLYGDEYDVIYNFILTIGYTYGTHEKIEYGSNGAWSANNMYYVTFPNAQIGHNIMDYATINSSPSTPTYFYSGFLPRTSSTTFTLSNFKKSYCTIVSGNSILPSYFTKYSSVTLGLPTGCPESLRVAIVDWDGLILDVDTIINVYTKLNNNYYSLTKGIRVVGVDVVSSVSTVNQITLTFN